MTTATPGRLYTTRAMLERTLRISYPVGNGRLTLRSEQDGEKDIDAEATSEDGNIWTFRVRADQPFVYFKPCLVRDGAVRWAVGPNQLLLMGEKDQRICYPFFLSPAQGHFSPLVEFQSAILNTLIDRVLEEPPRDVGFYLDSGWPGDNYEVTMAMATALITRGWRYGHNLMHLSFPQAEHNEAAWGMRLHLPLQFLNGAVARASRIHAPVLGDLPSQAAEIGRPEPGTLRA